MTGLQAVSLKSLNQDYEVVLAEDPFHDCKNWTDVRTDVDICDIALRDFQLVRSH